MKRFRIILFFISAGLIIAALFYLDYSDIFSRRNLGSLLGIVSMVLNIAVILLSIKEEKKNSGIH